jgi:hypothetical protein
MWALHRIVQLFLVASIDSLVRPAGWEPEKCRFKGCSIPVPSSRPTLTRRGEVNFPHPYLTDVGIVDPGDSFHEVVAGLLGHDLADKEHGPHRWVWDAGDQWAVTRKILEAAGLPEDWGVCKTCNGYGIHPDHYQAYEEWEPEDPPEGEGWQMWETVSEGSPISPVFQTPEGLAQWLADSRSKEGTYDQWLAIVRLGWVPSGVLEDGTVVSGVQAVEHLKENDK